jgi:hypothetical protein
VNDSLLTLKTNQKLLSAVERAASRKMTSEELREQRVSFVYGSMDSSSSVTRDRVRQMLLDQEGAAVSLVK